MNHWQVCEAITLHEKLSFCLFGFHFRIFVSLIVCSKYFLNDLLYLLLWLYDTRIGKNVDQHVDHRVKLIFSQLNLRFLHTRQNFPMIYRCWKNSSYKGGCRMTLVLWMTSCFMTSRNIYEWMLESSDVIGTFMNECVNSYATIKI